MLVLIYYHSFVVLVVVIVVVVNTTILSLSHSCLDSFNEWKYKQEDTNKICKLVRE